MDTENINNDNNDYGSFIENEMKKEEEQQHKKNKI